jgi:predicted dehydrogenase
MATPVEIALAGCGRWGMRILADLAALGARVRVADPSPGARRAALESGAAEAVEDAGALGEVEAAIVATPTLLHAATIDRLAARGIPVFCEKPLTADAASARRLANALGGRLRVMEKWRWHPAIEAIAGIARRGEVGPLRSLRTRRVQPSISGYDVDPVWVLAPHDLSIASAILGSLPRIARASAEFARASAESEDERVVALRGESEGPVEFSFEVSARAPLRRREVELAGASGRVSWSSADEHAIRVGGERVPVSREPPLRREIGAILGFLRGGPELAGSAAESAEAVAILEAARTAAGVTPSGRRSG